MWQSLTIRRRLSQRWKMKRHEKLVQLVWTTSRISVDSVTKYDGRSAEETEIIQKTSVWTPRSEETGMPVFFWTIHIVL